MIDPTNTEPIPVHKPHTYRVLSLLAILVLVVMALVSLHQRYFSESPAVVQPPAPNPIFAPDVQEELFAIQERVVHGEIPREEGERLTNELLNSI